MWGPERVWVSKLTILSEVPMRHPKAKRTPAGRYDLVMLVERDGFSVRAGHEACGRVEVHGVGVDQTMARPAKRSWR